ncbi:Pam3-gp28 family putative phage holin [Chelatococcus reniformis]|uniref:Holin n=1 Tax=Chelatococcus reniformis TaxID=1494448 RepID=A0A916XGX1_9HYPH|nr:hypothetical protein [Chelatococcus reniformis]GGC71006.1 hypothetical protein GCM10010994_31920 [Chelatococcus reniformis]
MNTNLTLPIRQALIGLGPLIAALGIMDATAWGARVDQLAPYVGIIMTVGGIAWQWWVSRPKAKIEQVAALPQVKGVVVDPTTAADISAKNVVATPAAIPPAGAGAR